MKKLLFILLALCVVFCGCEDLVRKDGGRGGYSKYDRDFDDIIEDKFDDKDDVFDLDDKEDRGDIEDDYFEALGKTYDSVEKLYGKITETEWINGPVYKFERSNSWYAFSEYKTENDKNIPEGRCTIVILPVSDFVQTTEPEIDEGLIASLSDRGISKGYEEMDGAVYFEITHDEYEITIYEDQYGDISGDSMAYVRILGEK